MPDSFDRREFLTLGGAAAAVGLAGCSLSTNGPGPQETETETSDPTAAPATGDEQERSGTAADPGVRDMESVYTEVYRNAIDSVVLVKTGSGQGTGFVFDDSHVVTNAHVVGQASAVDVRFTEGRWSEGDVVGTDPHADLAAVAVESVPERATPLPFVETGPTVGQRVVAIGNPYSLNGSLTTGVVSGTDRLIPGPTGYRIPDAVQTDAAVNPGNSGGPLMALNGRVAAVINSGGGDNIAFGISAALTRRVVPELVESGDYDHAYVGASFTDVTPTIAAANDVEEARGLLVTGVAPGGPADGVLRPSESRYTDAGRLPVGGDVVLGIDGTELVTTEDLWSYLALESRPGESVELSVVRDGQRRTVSLELGVRSR